MLILLVIACQTEAPPPAPEELVAPAVTTRSDCVFVDENRTEDENGRVTVNCAGEILQAKAVYVPGGSFDFEVEAPAAVAATP